MVLVVSSAHSNHVRVGSRVRQERGRTVTSRGDDYRLPVVGVADRSFQGVRAPTAEANADDAGASSDRVVNRTCGVIGINVAIRSDQLERKNFGVWGYSSNAKAIIDCR